MTEPTVASSDATNISTEIRRDGDSYVINGRKWWTTGAGSLHTEVLIVMGKTDPSAPLHAQQSQVLVPASTPGITFVRPLLACGDADAPKGHMEIVFDNVRVPTSNILWAEGKGFAISQGRLGPGRIHHCMRLVGQAERALSLMCARVHTRVTFGKPLSANDAVLQEIAKSRAEIDQARLFVFEAASSMDRLGNKSRVTRQLLSLVKAVVPQMTQRVADRAMQMHGAMGICQDTPLFAIWVAGRSLRLADGPDEVHWRSAGQMELRAQQEMPLSKLGYHNKTASTAVFRKSTDEPSAEAKQRMQRAKL